MIAQEFEEACPSICDDYEREALKAMFYTGVLCGFNHGLNVDNRAEAYAEIIAYLQGYTNIVAVKNHEKEELCECGQPRNSIRHSFSAAGSVDAHEFKHET